MTAEAERAIIDKMRRGEPITVLDHIPTIDRADELDAFRAALIRNGRMTDEAQAAIYRRQKQIGRM